MWDVAAFKRCQESQTFEMDDLAVSEEHQRRSGAVPELFGHQVVVALDQERSVLGNLFIDELQATQHPLALLLSHRIWSAPIEANKQPK